MTKHVSITEFAAHAAELLSEVTETGEQVVILCDDRPVADLVPRQGAMRSLYGAAKGYVTHERDIVSPGDESWDATR